jgi:hypothetical protein
VVHIASLGDAGSYFSPLQLDPERVPLGMGSGFMWDKEVGGERKMTISITVKRTITMTCCY